MITKEEYLNFLKINNELCELINKKATELCRILYNRLPYGAYYSHEQDFEIYKEKYISVVYERYSCNERCTDSFDLPIEFLFDETYPEKYKKIHEEEVKKKEEEKLRLKKEKEENQKKKCEIFERKEYERLKKKFEKDNCCINIKVDEIWSDGDDEL